MIQSSVAAGSAEYLEAVTIGIGRVTRRMLSSNCASLQPVKTTDHYASSCNAREIAERRHLYTSADIDQSHRQTSINNQMHPSGRDMQQRHCIIWAVCSAHRAESSSIFVWCSSAHL